MDEVLKFDSSGQFVQTNLALQFSPLVGGYVEVVFGDNFVLKPALKTPKVHSCGASAWKQLAIFQWIIADVIKKTVLTHLIRIFWWFLGISIE